MGWLLGEKDVYRGRASHRGHGGHRGGIGTGKGFWWMAWLLGGKGARREEHRTEVAEWGLGRGGLFGGACEALVIDRKCAKVMFS
jgi:hypothetical protein